MDKLHDLAQKMEAALNKIEEVFNTYFEYVNQMTGRTTDFRNFTKKEQHDFFAVSYTHLIVIFSYAQTSTLNVFC